MHYQKTQLTPQIILDRVKIKRQLIVKPSAVPLAPQNYDVSSQPGVKQLNEIESQDTSGI